MNFLLDTHIILWALTDDPKLPEKARKIISDKSNNIFYSVISLFEIEVKHIAHPRELPVSSRLISELCKRASYIGY